MSDQREDRVESREMPSMNAEMLVIEVEPLEVVKVQPMPLSNGNT
jgi:hypothetical protein